MKYFVLFAAVILATVANAQITWFKTSLSCNTKYNNVEVNHFSHYISGDKLFVEFREGHFYANSSPCDKAEACKADVKLTTTCAKLGTSKNYARLTSGGGGAKVSTGTPTGGDATSYCTVDVLSVETPVVTEELSKCAKVQRLVSAASDAASAADYKVVVADKDCTANAGSAVEITTTCVALNSYGSAILKEGTVTLYPGDTACGVVAEGDKITFPAEGTCGEYETGKYAKYTVTDGTANLKYECTDKECSTSCVSQALEKDKCLVATNKGSLLYGSLGLSGGAIAGIVIGSILGIALIAGIVIVVVKKSGGSSSSAV